MIAEPSTPSNLMTFCWLARPLKRTSFQVPVPAFCEPGACSISCDIWRPLTGRFSTSRSLTLTPMRAELMSSARRVAHDGDRFADTGRLKRQVEREFLRRRQLHARVFERREPGTVTLIV